MPPGRMPGPQPVPQSRAGDYQLAIRVNSQAAPDQVAEVTTTLTVNAFHQTKSEVQPQRVKAGQKVQVVVENRGNTKQTYTVQWHRLG